MVKDLITSTWSLTGVVSHGMNDQCNPKDYAVFVNVEMFLPWILKNANNSISYSNYFSCDDGRSRVFSGNCRVKRSMLLNKTKPCPRCQARDRRGICRRPATINGDECKPTNCQSGQKRDKNGFCREIAQPICETWNFNCSN